MNEKILNEYAEALSRYIDAGIGKSMQSVKEGKVYFAEDIATEICKDFGV